MQPTPPMPSGSFPASPEMGERDSLMRGVGNSPNLRGLEVPGETATRSGRVKSSYNNHWADGVVTMAMRDDSDDDGGAFGQTAYRHGPR